MPETPKSSVTAFTVIHFSNSTRLVTFYWSKEAEKEKNGPNFRYMINSNEETSQPFADQLQQNNEDVCISISAVNDVGSSNSSIKITVPKEEIRQKLPEVQKSILIDNHGKFLVLWNFQQNLVPATAIVTIIWCSQSSTRHCGNGIEWEEVNVDEKRFELPKEEKFINHAFTSILRNNSTKGMKIVPCRLSIGSFKKEQN